jgi:phosphoribosylformimino-5-aminoimidazole carboxamide ribotide isomerase
MLVIPAIDLLDGKAVRLLKGRREDVTVYSNDPVSLACDFEKLGVRTLHVVDLNAAFGDGNNRETIRRILECTGMDIEVGGGVRDMDDLRNLVSAGVQRAIIGTAAFKNERFFAEALDAFGERIVLSLDVDKGRVAIKGWVETVDIDPIDFVNKYKSYGLQWVISTDISRDGMLTGPNIEWTGQLLDATGINVIASGGVSSLADIQALSKIPGLYGVITGKAIYENKFSVAEAIKYAG